jgi:hypothetical protein
LRPEFAHTSHVSVQDVHFRDALYFLFQQPCITPINFVGAMEQTQNDFKYEPLKEGQIRLIKLHPAANRSDNIKCSIFPTFLKKDDAPRSDTDLQYEALSYFWGKAKDTQPILLEGQEFKVTINLNSALRHIRLSDAERILWVDAICINQANKKERTEQVTLMGRIYRNASCDLLWLGEDTGLDPAVIELLKLKFDPNDEATKNASIERVMDSLRHTQSGDNLWDQLHKILGEPDVWTRIWIVQEVLLAPDVKVIYGFEQFPWSTMEAISTCRTRRAIEIRETTSLSVSMHNNASLQILDSRDDFLSGKLNSLTEAVDTFGFFAASEDRDKLFALLGLLKEEYRFEPDYETPAAKVYSGITKNYIRKTGDLRILTSDLVYAAPAEGKDVLPSWVPKFNTKSGIPSEPSALHDCSSTSEYYAYSAGKSKTLQGRMEVNQTLVPVNSPARFCDFPELHGKHPEPHILDLHGFLLDTVGLIPNSKLVINWTLENAIKAYHDAIADLTQKGKNPLRSETEIKGESFNVEELVDIYFDTLYLGMPSRMLSIFEAVGIDMEKDKKDFQNLFTDNLDKTSATDDWRKIRDTLRVLACQEKFALTSAGYFAMVPEKTLVGDIVCIIYGGEIPLVLREDSIDAGNKKYQLIGPAYIHGFMDEEALLMQDKGLLEKGGVFHIV